MSRALPLSRALQMAWARGPARWWLWFAGVGVALVVLLVCARAWQRQEVQAAELDAQGARAFAPAAALASAIAPQPDFAQRLGAPLPASQIAHELQRACAQAGVQLVSMQAQQRDPSAEQLGRLELTLSLRGGYAGSKHVIKQVVERFGNLTVQRLRMRRGAATNDVETQVILSLWSAPLVASGEVR